MPSPVVGVLFTAGAMQLLALLLALASVETPALRIAAYVVGTGLSLLSTFHYAREALGADTPPKEALGFAPVADAVLTTAAFAAFAVSDGAELLPIEDTPVFFVACKLFFASAGLVLNLFVTVLLYVGRTTRFSHRVARDPTADHGPVHRLSQWRTVLWILVSLLWFYGDVISILELTSASEGFRHGAAAFVLLCFTVVSGLYVSTEGQMDRTERLLLGRA